MSWPEVSRMLQPLAHRANGHMVGKHFDIRAAADDSTPVAIRPTFRPLLARLALRGIELPSPDGTACDRVL